MTDTAREAATREAQLAAENAQLEAQNAELQACDAELQAQNEELQARHGELHARIVELHARLQQWEGENWGLDAMVTALRGELVRLGGRPEGLMVQWNVGQQ